MNGKYVSYKRVLESFHRDFPYLNYPASSSSMLEWIGELMGLLSVPASLSEKVGLIPIAAGKGKLPVDLHSITTCALLYKGTDATDESAFNINLSDYSGAGALDEDTTATTAEYIKKFSLLPLHWATSRFHMKWHNQKADFLTTGRYEYKVNDNYMFLNIETACVAISYHGIPVDCDGYPMLPDNESWITAAKYTIAYKIASIMWGMGTLKEAIYRDIEQNRDWYVAQAGNVFKDNNWDEMDAYLNDERRMLTVTNPNATFFSNIGLPEEIPNVRR